MNYNLWKKPADYFSQTRFEMLKFIPKGARRALDVGCGEGGFGSQLKQKFHMEVWGVEMDSKAGDKAKEILDKVLVGNVVDIIGDIPDNYFDCIIFNDVLEHLADPYNVLSEMKKKLSAGGAIVASIPNVRYFHNLRKLIFNKQWRYEDQGILDKTHLRFFTKKSIIDMFESLGFDIETIKGINPITGWKFNILDWFTFGFLEDARYLEFACVARIK